MKFDMSQAYKDGVTHALCHQWKSISDGMPDNHQSIFICYRYRHGDSNKYNVAFTHEVYMERFGILNGIIDLKDIIAWMPVPEVVQLTDKDRLMMDIDY